MERCMICEKRPAQEFGPYKVEDLLCEQCATDPREAHDNGRPYLRVFAEPAPPKETK